MIKLLQVGDINRQMWQQVNKHKSILPYPHQISFMVDRTVEHFKVQLQKKMKKKAQEAARRRQPLAQAQVVTHPER